MDDGRVPTTQSIAGRVLGRLNLRFPTLFLIFAGLTIVDFIVPDFLPFIDELGLLLLTVLLSRWKARRADPIRPSSAGAVNSLPDIEIRPQGSVQSDRRDGPSRAS